MNRRGFLKGLTGIAGIVAAQQAPAIVKLESLMALPSQKLIMPGDELITDTDEVLLEMMHIRLAERAQRVVTTEDGERHYVFPDGSTVKPTIVGNLDDALDTTVRTAPEIYTGAKPTNKHTGLYCSDKEEIERIKSENVNYDMYANDENDDLLIVAEEFSARVETLNDISARLERAREIKLSSQFEGDAVYGRVLRTKSWPKNQTGRKE